MLSYRLKGMYVNVIPTCGCQCRLNPRLRSLVAPGKQGPADFAKPPSGDCANRKRARCTHGFLSDILGHLQHRALCGIGSFVEPRCTGRMAAKTMTHICS